MKLLYGGSFIAKMFDNLLVTVLIPVFNSPNVFETIESVLNQNYSNIQLIVLDDASTNNNKIEIEEYILNKARNNISDWNVVKNRKNIGTIRNLNNGIHMASGEIIFTLGGDDVFYDENVIGDVVNEFRKTNAKCITALRVMCNKDFTQVLEILPSEEQINYIRYLKPIALFEVLCQKKTSFLVAVQ